MSTNTRCGTRPISSSRKISNLEKGKIKTNIVTDKCAYRGGTTTRGKMGGEAIGRIVDEERQCSKQYPDTRAIYQPECTTRGDRESDGVRDECGDNWQTPS